MGGIYRPWVEMKNGCRGLGCIAETTLRHYSAACSASRAALSQHSPVASSSSQRCHLRSVATPGPSQRRPPARSTLAFPTSPKIANRVKAVLRRFPQPVVVVTAAAPPTWPSPRSPVGMTVSSFTSLDLEDDVAAVCFNVRRPSRTLDAIAEGHGVFNVHILAGDHSGAQIAHYFTRPNSRADAVDAPGNTHGLLDHVEDNLDCTLSTDYEIEALAGQGLALPPMLRGPGVLYVLTCRVPRTSQEEATLPQIMSHSIVVAGVAEVFGIHGSEGESRPPKLGLLYGDRQYRGPGVAFMNGDGSTPRKEE